MKIASLQFSPVIGKREENINRAQSLLEVSGLRQGDVDLLVLPELAFPGYNFASSAHIKPCLEEQANGITRFWAVSTAQGLGCHVIVGYPESSVTNDVGAYNAAYVVSPGGDVVGNYRKTHLYYTDETWAAEGDGFFCQNVDGLGVVGLGICMDINPYQFKAPWQAYEFANHVLAGGARLVVLSMAWLTRLDESVLKQSASEPDMDTLTYWLERFYPFMAAKLEYDVVVVFCNRCGTEPNEPRTMVVKSGQVVPLLESTVCYAGSSCVVKFKANGRGVEILDVLGKAEEKVLIVDTEQTEARYQLRQKATESFDGDVEQGREAHAPC